MSTFALPYGLDSSRLGRVEEVVPGWFVHTVVVRAPEEQLDAEVQGMDPGELQADGNAGAALEATATLPRSDLDHECFFGSH